MRYTHQLSFALCRTIRAGENSFKFAFERIEGLRAWFSYPSLIIKRLKWFIRFYNSIDTSGDLLEDSTCFNAFIFKVLISMLWKSFIRSSLMLWIAFVQRVPKKKYLLAVYLYRTSALTSSRFITLPWCLNFPDIVLLAGIIYFPSIK